MKHWRIDYSVKDIGGKCTETFKIIEAPNMTEAIETAYKTITGPLKCLPEVTDAVIWGIGIVEDDVFAE